MFRFRPLALWVTAFAAGVLCAVFADGIAGITVLFCIGVLCVLCVAVRRFPYRSTLLPLLLAVLMGMSCLALHRATAKNRVSDCYGKEADVIGDVAERDSYGFTFTVLSSSESSLPKGTRVRMYYDFEEDIQAGDRVYCRLALSDPGLSGYSYGTYVSAGGDVARVDTGRAETALVSLRKHICRLIDKNFSASTAGIAKAVLVGDGNHIDPLLYSAYRDSGISHILVISGFHMSIILMSAYTVISSTFAGKRYAGAVCIVLAVLFGFFVGFTPSVSRAAVMCIAVFAGGMFNYKNDSFTSLFAALGILLAVNPYSLFSVGLQLSFLCSLGIITVAPVFDRTVTKIKKKSLRFVADRLSSVALSAVASLFSFPVVWYAFGEFSVISPIVNMFAIPISGGATVLGYIGIFIPPAAFIADILFKAVNGIAVLSAGVDTATVSTFMPGMGIAAVIAAVSVAVVCSAEIKKRIKTFGVCILAFALCVAGSAGANAYLSRTRASVDCVSYNGCYQMAAASKGECVFIDRGGAYVNTDKVYRLGCTRINAYIMLECDSYGLSNLCKAFSNAGIDKIYISDKGRNTDIYRRVLEIASEWGKTVEVFEENITLPVGDGFITAGEEIYIEYGRDVFYCKATYGTVYLDGKE